MRIRLKDNTEYEIQSIKKYVGDNHQLYKESGEVVKEKTLMARAVVAFDLDKHPEITLEDLKNAITEENVSNVTFVRSDAEVIEESYDTVFQIAQTINDFENRVEVVLNRNITV